MFQPLLLSITIDLGIDVCAAADFQEDLNAAASSSILVPDEQLPSLSAVVACKGGLVSFLPLRVFNIAWCLRL